MFIVLLVRDFKQKLFEPFAFFNTSMQESCMGGKSESGEFIKEAEPYFASLASDGRHGFTTPAPHQAFTSQTQVKSLGNQFPFLHISGQAQPENGFPNQIYSHGKLTHPELSDFEEPSRSYNASLYIGSFSLEPEKKMFPLNVVGQSGVNVKEDLTNEIQKSQDFPKSYLESTEFGGDGQQESAGASKNLSRSTTWSSSASLPRGYRRSDSSTRLSSAITARPFGAKPPRHSLPRLYSVS